jgi:hypothetical protein
MVARDLRRSRVTAHGVCLLLWARGVGWLPLIEWMFSTETMSHDDTTPSIWVVVPESVVVVAITRHATGRLPRDSGCPVLA